MYIAEIKKSHDTALVSCTRLSSSSSVVNSERRLLATCSVLGHVVRWGCIRIGADSFGATSEIFFLLSSWEALDLVEGVDSSEGGLTNPTQPLQED